MKGGTVYKFRARCGEVVTMEMETGSHLEQAAFRAKVRAHIEGCRKCGHKVLRGRAKLFKS